MPFVSVLIFCHHWKKAEKKTTFVVSLVLSTCWTFKAFLVWTINSWTIHEQEEIRKSWLWRSFGYPNELLKDFVYFSHTYALKFINNNYCIFENSSQASKRLLHPQSSQPPQNQSKKTQMSLILYNWLLSLRQDKCIRGEILWDNPEWELWSKIVQIFIH